MSTLQERLARECAKLDPRRERALADEGLAIDAAAWPDYMNRESAPFTRWHPVT